MKTWDVSPDILRDPTLARLVDGTRPLLEQEVGPTAGLVDAEWRPTGDASQRLVLRISDWTWPSGVEATFDRTELRSELGVRRKMRWLWGDLLQARNHHQIQQLKSTVG